jgi:hypothetical protein
VALAGEESASFTVAADGGIFKILDPGGAEVPRLGAPLAAGDPAAPARLVERLVHLARFHSVRTLANRDPASPLANRLALELLALPADYQEGDDAVPVPFPAGAARVAVGRWCCMRLENRSSEDIHVVVLDLQPDWGISRLIPSDSTTLELSPGQRLVQVMRAWLPDGCDAGTDVLKAIATVVPTDYDWLLLDPIEAPSSSTRAAPRAPRNELESLMAALQRPDEPTRHVRQIPRARWTTAEVELAVFRG